MNISMKRAVVLVVGLAVAYPLGGCGSSQGNTGAGSDFEKAIRAPKGPMPAAARAAMEQEMAKQKARAGKPVGQP